MPDLVDPPIEIFYISRGARAAAASVQPFFLKFVLNFFLFRGRICNYFKYYYLITFIT